ncbi:BatD family protein [Xanthobacter sp. DSM 24535]|uniref:BatD family protein n=1 Tax=Roseixanthobacter psychrophilus TaxID=3119917 RepID=UPI00372A312E
MRLSLRPLRALALVLAVLACALAPAFAAGPTSSVDRTQLSVGESFELVITLVGGDGAQPPDLSPLARDFDILDRNRRSRLELVNGRRTQINEWVLVLAPKRSGTISVPALGLAGQSTAPIRLQVDPATTVNTEARPLFVQVEPLGPAPYVQGEMLVAVRIYTNGPLLGGALTPPEAVGATFTKVGDQRMFSKVIGRQRYRVIEQGYIMRPQRSGSIEIGPVTLEAQFPSFMGGALPSETARLLGRPGATIPSGVDPNIGRTVTVRSDPVQIEVKARPADVTGWFLPAQSVTLSSTWNPPLAQAKVGETLTRTLTLEAVGATPNQLPPLPVPDADGVRQYEESSRSDQATLNGKAGAVLTKTVSVVPTRAGTVTLPGIEIGWWNPDTRKSETAHLPPETFTVAPASGQALVPAPQPVAVQPAPVVASTPAPEPPATTLSLPQWIGDLLSLRAAGAFAAALLVIAVTARLVRGSRGRKAGAAAPRRRNRGGAGAEEALQALRAACKAEDAAAAHAALLAWMRTRDGTTGSSETFHTAAMAKASEDLQRHLYSGARGRWNGAALLSALAGECASGKRTGGTRARSRLAPLYP